MVLDDTYLEESACPISPVSCSFESGLCGWWNEMLPEVQWLVGRGITTNPDLVSGLHTDHTTMDGLYAYVDFTSNASVPGEFLFCTTPLCFPKVIKCQSCYHVVGKSKQYSQFVYSTTSAVTLLQMCQHNCKVK